MFLIKFLAISVVITLAIPLVLIVSQPVRPLPAQTGLDFTGRGATDITPVPLQTMAARDGSDIHYRNYPAQSDLLLVMVHGSGWHGRGFDPLAQDIAASGLAHVIVPDLRGHGPNTETRGDVAYIGQLEHDLADLINAHKTPNQRIVMLGHSSGGGLTIRYAGGDHPALDHAILISPYLHHSAPTMRPNAGGWAHPLLRRVIGLSMLNMYRITALNGLTAVQFNMPDTVKSAGGTDAYSFRLNTSYAPRNDWQSDVAALPKFDLITGPDDEAFVAAAYQPALSAITSNGTYHSIPQTSHIDLSDAPATNDLIRDILRGL